MAGGILFPVVFAGRLFAAAAVSTSPAPAESPPPAAPAIRLAAPVPFAPDGPEPVLLTSSVDWAASAGRDALNNGYPGQAVQFFRDALGKPGLSPAVRDSLNLDLASAYLAQDKPADAAAAMKLVQDQASSAYTLRSSLLAVRNKNWADAATQLARISPDNLSAVDRPWYYAATALLSEERKDASAAQAAWENARKFATTPLQSDQFGAALWRGRILLTADASPERAETLRQNADRYPNQSLGAQYAGEYAVVLDLLGQRGNATAVINKWLPAVPDSDHRNKNTLRLLGALFAIENSTPTDATRAQQLLQQVLLDRVEAGSPEADSVFKMQETALGLLHGSWQENRDREALKRFFDALILTDPPLLKQIYLLQCQIALGLNMPDAAAMYAQALLSKFPPTPGQRDFSRENAWRLLAYVAAQRGQYHAAASDLLELRKELPPGPDQNLLLAQLADLTFLDRDYRGASENYAILLAESAPPRDRGLLLRQAVDSDLNAGLPAAAAARLDQSASKADIDTISRWKAEWNLLSSLRENERDADAFARLNRLLSPAGGGRMPPELRLRLLWLAARLAVDVRDPSAVERAQAFRQEIESLPAVAPGIDQKMRDSLAANALLLSYQAAADADKPAEAEQFYKTLQSNFPASEAAKSAVFLKAAGLWREDKTAEAQNLMTQLADQNPDDLAFTPLARYAAALYAIPRGKSNQYEEALDLLRKFVSKYPDHPLVYQARLKQGELLRALGRYDEALGVYQYLLNTYHDSPFTPQAEMGKAVSLAGMAALSPDPERRKEAIAAYERLVDLPSMPVAARIEAGVRWGMLLANGDSQGANRDEAGAAKVFLQIKAAFLDDAHMAALERGDRGSWWMNKCLIELAQIWEKQGHFEDARRLFEQVDKLNLADSEGARRYLEKRPDATTPAAALSAPPPASVSAPPPPASARGNGG